MNPNKSQLDLESGRKEQSTNVRMSKTHSPFFQQAAALLSIWSVLVINEGAIRLINSNPAGGLSGGRPSIALVFLAALSEVLFGLLGLFIGLAASILRLHSTLFTKISILIQFILGDFVFVIFVFLIPAFRAADLMEPSLPGLSLGQSQFLVALGILTSFQFCLALQGGQFLFMARLVCAATGKDFLKQQSGTMMRAMFWNGNMGLAGLWTLITGVLVTANVGSGKLDMPFVSPPNVGLVPGLTIATGLAMILWAGVGMVVGKRAMKGVPLVYYVGSFIVYLLALMNYGIVQFGLMENAPAGDVALHAGLVFMVVFLGPYFVHQASEEAKTES